MKSRCPRLPLVASLCLALCLSALSVVAEQSSPRDIWPQATSAANAGDIDAAIKQTNALIETGKSYGLKTFPQYAASAAAMARQADKENSKPVANWATKAADQLDPSSSSVAFSNADHADRARSRIALDRRLRQSSGRRRNRQRGTELSARRAAPHAGSRHGTLRVYRLRR